jgi:putative membrane protein
MNRIFAAACCLALVAVPAISQEKHAPGTMPMSDQQFIDMAAQTDMLEANLAQKAANQAASDDVKSYAQMLLTDHNNDYQQLATIAAKDNLTIPKALDDEHNKMIAPLDKLNGKAFDQNYIHAMIAGHTKAIAVYTKESSSAENGDVKSYAAATLPTLQKHLDGAKDLMKKAK